MTNHTCRVFLEDALLMTIPSEIVPQVDLPDGLTAIDTSPRRISLVSRRGMRSLRGAFDAVDLEGLNPPIPVFGATRLVVRPAKEDRQEMACLVAPVENHEQISQFVNDLFAKAGVKNPEKRFVYHLTVANNAGGHPRGSIAYLNKSDFEGPALSCDRGFEQREVPSDALEAHSRHRSSPGR